MQSLGMARWLSLWLATDLGLCANVRFPFPASFVWETFRAVLGPLPPAPSFDPTVTSWHLMALLQQLDPAPAFEPLRAYLGDGNDDRRRWELARKIADTFDQYLVYRPDWIQAWERGDDDGDWQPHLWRQLVARVGGAHRVHLWETFTHRRLLATDVSALPPRLALFGIPSMPPLYLDVFAQLAAHIDVHCFVLNPCQESWSDIRRGGDLVAQPVDVGSRLLTSFGRQGREFLDQLVGYESDEETHFEIPPGQTLLACLQRDILTLTDQPSSAPASLDLSVQVHACHSAMREIEVLHDQLLVLFDTFDLQPAQVVVMTPDIDAYAPAIDAVFGTVPRDRYIPYTIADRRLEQESPLVEAFLQLLGLPSSRFEAGEVLALLAVPAVRRRFDLTDVDLTRVQTWVRESGVRWGLDADMRAAVGVPATPEHTWRFGLDRLLLGYALGQSGARFADPVTPYGDIDGTDARLLGRLHRFVDTLGAAQASLAAPRPPAEWAAALRELLERCLAADDTEERDLQAVRTAIGRLASTATDGAYAEPISLDLVTTHLRESLDVPGGGARFLAGGVTFCALMPMRSIPFQVVCLVGMNDGSVPRANRPISFDRMAGDRRRGDRSRRDDDRYLFLEALTSARVCFYVSYVGRDIHDNTTRPPSILVTELLDCLGSDTATTIITQHPLQAFSRKYFDGQRLRLVSHSSELCQASRTMRRRHAVSARFAPIKLPPAGAEWRTLTLDRLLQFFVHPSRFLLRERLGIRIDAADTRVESREPFVLDGLGRHNVQQAVLALQTAGGDVSAAVRSLRGRGLLPHGAVGGLAVEAAWPTVQVFGQRLAVLQSGPSQPSVPLNLDIGGVRIVGQLEGLGPEGRVAYRLGKTRPADRAMLWIAHLVLQVAAPAGIERQTRWLSSEEELVLVPVDDASTRLAELARYYLDGLERPLPFFPKSAWEFVSKPKRAWTAARDCWEGSDYATGEGEDPYHAVAFRGLDPIDDEFAQLATDVFGPWQSHEGANE